MKQKLVFMTICLVGIVGCSKQNDQWAAASETPASGAKSNDRSPASSTEEKITRLEERLRKLQVKVAGLELDATTVSADSPSYSIAKTRHGPFTVSLSELTPYLDGYRAKLRIGNLTTAEFNGFAIKASWGPLLGGNVDQYLSERKDKVFHLTTALKPGSFTDVQVALTPAKPDEVKEIDVPLTFDQISLRKN